MKIALAGGHSKAAPGASGYLDEYTEDRKVVSALIAELQARGHTVVNCSNEKTTQNSELAEEVRIANGSGADLFIAIHLNAASTTSGARGSECWHYTNSDAGRDYAARVSAALAGTLGLPNRGAKATTGLYVLRKTSMTAILPEVCFVDAKGDADAYNRVGYRAVASAIADAVSGTAVGTTTPPASSGDSSGGASSAPVPGAIADVQRWAGSTADGSYGPKTKAALVRKLQSELNKQYGKGLAVDGIWGPRTKAACVNVRNGARGNITRVLQGALICHSYSTSGFDGIFGSGTDNAVRAFQGARRLIADGVAGRETFAALLE